MFAFTVSCNDFAAARDLNAVLLDFWPNLTLPASPKFLNPGDKFGLGSLAR